MYTHDVDLIWTVKNEKEAVYSKELQEIAENNIHINYSVWPSEKKGHLAMDKLSMEDIASKAYFICGPESLKKSIIMQLKTLGVEMSDIYDEEFAFR